MDEAIVDGSPSRLITNFGVDRIASFSWSSDGKTLAVNRIHTDSVVVLLDIGTMSQ